MLDHSKWSCLPRGITPSDIDAVIANGAFFLHIEFSKTYCDWSSLPFGQRKMYQDQVVTSKGDIWAVLAKHSVPSHREIDTVCDVESFQVMFRGFDGQTSKTNVINAGLNGGVWKNFTINWFKDRAAAVTQAYKEADNLA
mgnify:CR=1 FL=1